MSIIFYCENSIISICLKQILTNFNMKIISLFFRGVPTYNRYFPWRTCNKNTRMGSRTWSSILDNSEFMELRLGWQWHFQNPQGQRSLWYRKFDCCRIAQIMQCTLIYFNFFVYCYLFVYFIRRHVLLW